MAKVVSLDSIEEARERELGYSWHTERSIKGLMQPGCAKGRRLGKRPVSREGSLNSRLIARSPGSRHKGFDFVKAVYAERTGQE